MKKKVVVYLGDSTHKKSPLEQVLTKMKLPYQMLHDSDLHQLCGYLMDLDGFEVRTVQEEVHFASDLMLLHNISDEEIMEMNKLLQEQGIVMKRKAMLTEHNQHWILGDLMKEIEQEHRYFQYREEILALLQASSELIIDSYTKESWKTYEEAFYRAYDALQKETSLEDIQQVYEMLVEAKESLIKR